MDDIVFLSQLDFKTTLKVSKKLNSQLQKAGSCNYVWRSKSVKKNIKNKQFFVATLHSEWYSDILNFT